MKIELKIIISLVVAIIFYLPNFCLASDENGTIDISYKYAWSNNIGTVNFGNTYGNVHISDTALSGYAWSPAYGWINLSPINGGVVNDGEGNLSGYAWGENLGWINFSAVKINNFGKFTGQATGDIIGILTFDCSSCDVRTDWRAASSRTSAGALPATATNPPTSSGGSVGGLKVFINNNDEKTNSRQVVLTFDVGNDVVKMAISNSLDFSKISQENFVNKKNWELTAGDGEKKVYVKFYTKWGVASNIILDSIILEESLIEEEEEDEILEETVEENLVEEKIEEKLKDEKIEEIKKEEKVEEVKAIKPIFTKLLKIGLSGKEVGILQTFLKELGYFKYPSITGYFGPITRSALLAYQKARKINLSGQVDEETIRIIEKEDGEKINNLLQETENNYIFKNLLKFGMIGAEVRELQIKLRDMGYFTYPYITGYFGEVTKKAVIDLQRDYKLFPYPGHVGPGTREVLNNN